MKGQEIRGFQSEVKPLLNLMIHSLYSNKEVFLRELISNASDAADKLRFRALSQPDLYEGNSELRVRLSYNKTKRTITMNDNGIGMNRDEVISNLGTIAKSGTKSFLESINPDQKEDNQLIGQFGIGFYSIFIVADRVTVCTRAAGAKSHEGVLWESTGEGDYTISNIIKSERGTSITLHLREGEEEFLDDQRLKNIIEKYSDHIALPVEIETRAIGNKENCRKDLVTWKRINKAQALWTRNKADISDEEYKEFYKHLSHDFQDPLIWSHNRVEGKQEYTSLLYIPTQASWNMWHHQRKYGLKLYVQRVFIMDDAEQFMPNYLRFVKGVIDSNDLPLNVSREILQGSRIIQSIKSALTRRILSMLDKLVKDNTEQYQLFWQKFGQILKEGVAEDSLNRESIVRLLRFSSTHNDSSRQTVSLEEYIGRMIEGQDKIYFITANSYSAAKNSPHLEILRGKSVEVLLLSDRIDEWVMSYLTEFNGKTFQSISKADISLDKLADLTGENEEQKNNIETLEPLVERIKTYLGDRVKKVKLTRRLTDTPAVVTTDANDISTQMAKIFAEAGQATQKIQYIFELNPNHTLIKHIAVISDSKMFKKWIEVLLDQALLVERGTLENPNQFVRRVNNLLTSGWN